MPEALESKVLSGRDAICEFLGIGKTAFYSLVKEGLPATVIDGRWYAHKDNLNIYFQRRTRLRMKEIPQDAE